MSTWRAMKTARQNQFESAFRRFAAESLIFAFIAQDKGSDRFAHAGDSPVQIREPARQLLERLSGVICARRVGVGQTADFGARLCRGFLRWRSGRGLPFRWRDARGPAEEPAQRGQRRALLGRLPRLVVQWWLGRIGQKGRHVVQRRQFAAYGERHRGELLSELLLVVADLAELAFAAQSASAQALSVADGVKRQSERLEVPQDLCVARVCPDRPLVCELDIQRVSTRRNDGHGDVLAAGQVLDSPEVAVDAKISPDLQLRKVQEVEAFGLHADVARHGVRRQHPGGQSLVLGEAHARRARVHGLLQVSWERLVGHQQPTGKEAPRVLVSLLRGICWLVGAIPETDLLDDGRDAQVDLPIWLRVLQRAHVLGGAGAGQVSVHGNACV
eukprot:scaffold554_cov245-Pinguiococcus_pyrenoidosus.AAC.4